MALDIVVFPQEPKFLPVANELAVHLGCEIAREVGRAAGHDLVLVLGEDGLVLESDGMELRHDFSYMARRVKNGALQHELLVRAARVKGTTGVLRAIDATAGFGEDSLLLASAGFEVELYESDPVIAALLVDGLRRAAGDARFSGAMGRMRLHEKDSVQALQRLDYEPDVILLDPMFPERRKSAAVKKKFQLLHKLERPCADETALLDAAFAAHPRKIVVKRPLKGPYLAGRKPSYAIFGKAIRYDVHVLPRKS